MASDAEGREGRGFPGGFTVLMAVYHRDDAALFRRALESVRASTLRPDDFVLVVDGPVPPALEDVIADAVREQGVRVVRMPTNQGLAAALNAGLAEVRTEWVVRADADDLNVRDRFERQARALEAADGRLDLLGSAILEVDRAGEPVAVRAVPLRHEEIVSWIGRRNPFNHMTVAFRTAAAVAAGGYPDIHLKEDYALWASMIARGARCANLDQVLVRATAGRDLDRRRGGLRHARSEWDLQLLLFRRGQKGLLSAAVFGVARASLSLVPSAVRGRLYRSVFRRPPA